MFECLRNVKVRWFTNTEQLKMLLIKATDLDTPPFLYTYSPPFENS